MVLVIKIGGTAGVPVAAIIDDICQLRANGEAILIVHGGSVEANRLGAALSLPPRILRSPDGIESRYTDPQTLEVVTMALRGLVNPGLVSRLVRRGVPAIGLSGIDGALVRAKLKAAAKHVENGRTMIVRDNRTGQITAVDHALLHRLLDLDLLPVISPPAIDLEAGPLNVDADRMAAAIAAAIKATRLIFVSNTNGILSDLTDPASTIRSVPFAQIGDVITRVAGGMKAKVMAAEKALRAGVEVNMADARAERPLLESLAGAGTRFEPPCKAALTGVTQ